MKHACFLPSRGGHGALPPGEGFASIPRDTFGSAHPGIVENPIVTMIDLAGDGGDFPVVRAAVGDAGQRPGVTPTIGMAGRLDGPKMRPAVVAA
ncbi:hypothetical protein FOB72_18590 [Cupriavidus pauculus]|uniref:Uncharacterized protein n=1 Tax=Cupriavidus pauculus TaxID=82633 RepID=A0A5P2H997_9BURK|nr:hypothetical protein [Cupriavidus pauculus]QET04164.1 hypothetical protein FOB72_18590 [Cupriavidus pauculus]